ncbi:MAG TPA: SigB/SigF/SigG family RNA polymerase sigma factor [Streptosporangiaceae bacterium]
MDPRASLEALPDSELLARLHTLPRHGAEHDAICEILVSRHIALVRACVRRYRDSPEPVEDLMQVGYVGLLKAINNYDPAFGNGLSAYAEPCVTGEIKRHFRDKRWQVRVSRQAQELLLAMRGADERLAQQLGHPPSNGELASELGVTERDILDARQADLVFSSYSLDAPLTDADESTQLADVLGEQDEAVEHITDIEAVNSHLDELPAREQRILMMRFYGNLTQSEIGDRLGISQMHVSRLLTRALSYLHDQLLVDEQ